MNKPLGMLRPLFKLKHYQQKSLDVFERYLKNATMLDADTAFYKLTKRPYSEVPALPSLPYVCLRIPTGGGKTVMASYAVNIAADHWLSHDYPLVLWLVPSNAIREQTLKALKNREHPYRMALAERFGSNVQVMDITQALYVTRPDLQANCCILVSTIQSFRVDDREGRKVYEADGALMDHFSGLDERQLAHLERGTDGQPIPSLENTIRLHRPMVIVDEAHNVRSKLSYETLARLAPSLILELTATPQLEHNPDKGDYASNILTHVSAAELKAEEMIKLPVRLRGRADWKRVIGDALDWLNRLDEIAREEERETGEFIRPVMLLQAQPKNKNKATITVEEVKKSLLEDFRIPEEQVVIATGQEKGLEGLDIEARDCPVRFIITVQALKEGWDCPFAYILCSVAEQASATAVEQIMGRVLRMPKAKRKKHEELNQAYVFSATQSFQNTANSLADGLVRNGFERIEARKLIQVPETLPGLGEDQSAFSYEADLPDDIDLPSMGQKVQEVTGGRAEIEPATGKLKYRGFMSEQDRQSLTLTMPESAAAIVKKLYHKSRGHRLVEALESRLKAEFRVPLMSVMVNGQQQLLGREHYLGIPWALDREDPSGILERIIVANGSVQEAEIDIGQQGKIKQNFIQDVHDQLSLTLSEPGWTIPALVRWIDRRLPGRKDITPLASQKFITAALALLMKNKGCSLDMLAREKFRLRNQLAHVVADLRSKREKRAFENFLFGADAPIIVNSDQSLVFDEQTYGYNQPYSGPVQFKKHYFEIVGDMKPSGEEHDCAVHIDRMAAIDCWVRNPVNQKGSFWLQTSTDKFYPDFVCRLTDGRVMAVEYKGAHLKDASDAQEKELVGKLWAERSGGQCLFVMPSGGDYGVIDRVVC